jgi:hypothetical protein
MEEFFTFQDSHNLNFLVTETLLNSSLLSDWKETIAQCKTAYDAQLYNVVVPTLITVAEGSLSKLIGTYKTKNVKMIVPTKTRASGPHRFELDQSTWLSISAIIEQLYEPSDFTKSVPDKLNRHWVLHGRQTPMEAKLNSLKLFNFLGSLDLVSL